MLALTLVALSAAPSIEECVADSEAGQVSRIAGRLLAARAKFEACSQPTCPGAVSSACTQWLAEVLDATPTVIVAARLDGVDQPLARARLDGAPWLPSLSGRPEPVDPGEHTLDVEYQGARAEQRLLVNVGEKDRLLVFSLIAPAQPPRPVVPVLLTAVTFVGVVLFAALGSSGRSEQGRLLASPCAQSKTCPPSAVAAVQQLYVAADVSLIIGVLAAGFAAWRWWAWLD